MSESPYRCFICNNRGVSARNSVQILSNQSVLLTSGRALSATLSDILERTIEPEQNLHSDIICKKCFKHCEEFDELNSRVKEIKSTLMEEFKRTLIKCNLDYNPISNTYNDSESEPSSPNLKMGSIPKLSPMPKNVVILHNGKKLAIQTSGKQPEIPRIDLDLLKNKIPSISLMKESPIKTKSKQPPIQSKIYLETAEEPNEIQINSKNTHEEIIENQTVEVHSTNEQITEIQSTERQSSDIQSTQKQRTESESTNQLVDSVDLHVDGQIQVLDDDISVSEIETDSLAKGNDNDDNSNGDKLDADKFIISEVEIMDGDFELQDGAIVMEQDENGDFLRVLNNTGRFLKDKHGNMLYQDNDQISVLLPEQLEEQIEDRTRIDFAGPQFKIECNDSNDEQIELQMSGDEDTANAIIQAAREQATTYIKLESGGKFPAVFRVQEVDAEQESEQETEIHTGAKRKRGGNQEEIVHRNGSMYTCLLCLDKPIEKITQQGTTNLSLETDGTRDEPEPSASDSNTKYECRVIGNAKSIAIHFKTEHGIKIYVCELCGDVLRKQSQYLKHIDGHNPQNRQMRRQSNILGMRIHECNVCNRKYSSKNILEEHMNIHNGIRPYECEICNKSFASKYTHQAHMKTHTNRPRPFACDQCGKSFLTLQNLSQHEKTHSGVKEHVCSVCGKAFGTQHNLEVHGVVHSGHKPYTCKTCGKAFARRAEIRDHERTHTGERPFPCDICGASFSQRSNLQSHRRACHLDDKRHSCAHCDRKFKRRRLLEYHIKASHTGERPHKCDICGASFVYPEHYKKHRRIHSGEKPYSCEVCGKPFNSRDNRNAHRFVHSDKKPYECMICGLGFMRKPLLYTHMNTAGHLTDTIVVNQPQLAVENGDTQGLVRIRSGISPVSTLGEVVMVDNIDHQNNSKVSNMSENNVPIGAKMLMSANTTYIIQNGEGNLDLAEESETEDNGILGLPDTIVSDEKHSENPDEASIQLEGDMEQHIQIVTDENGHVLTTDENGTMIRLVQIQLPGGEHGWVALGP